MPKADVLIAALTVFLAGFIVTIAVVDTLGF
jgi:hypothetical protein